MSFLSITRRFFAKNGKWLYAAIGLVLTSYFGRKIYFKVYRKYSQLPNGPIGFPFVGSLLSMINLKYFTLETLPKYGALAHYKIGYLNYIIVNDYKLSKQLFVDNRLLNRPESWKDLFEICPNVSVENGETWFHDRKKLVTSFAYVANQTYIERVVNKLLNEEIYKTLDECCENKKLWYPSSNCRFISLNTIFGIVFGIDNTVKSNDEVFHSYNLYMKIWFENLVKQTVVDLFIPKLIQKIFSTKQTYYYEKKIFELLNPLIEKSMNDFDKNHVETWLHHRMLDACSGNENIISSLDIKVKNKLKSEIFAILNAGIDTSGYVMEYSVLTLAKHPEAQQAVYNELSSLFTKENFSLSHLHECHVYRAFFNEVLRVSVSSPRAGPREATEDIQVHLTKDNMSKKHANQINQHYVIPKNCVVEMNMGSFFESETEEFDFSTWLTHDSANDKPKFHPNLNEHVFPFSLGRKCPGEMIAMKEMYYALAQLILHYKFVNPSKKPLEINTIYFLTCEITPKVGVCVEKR